MRPLGLLLIVVGLLIPATACEFMPSTDCDETDLTPFVDGRVAARITVTDSQLDPLGGEEVLVTFRGYRCGRDGTSALRSDDGLTRTDGDYLTDWFEFEWRNEQDRVEISYELPDHAKSGVWSVYADSLNGSSFVYETTVWLDQ